MVCKVTEDNISYLEYLQDVHNMAIEQTMQALVNGHIPFEVSMNYTLNYMKSIQLFDPSHQINAIINLEGEMASLTDLWKATGSQNKKDPSTWLSRDNVSELIETVSQMLNTPKTGVLKTKRGKTGGGTWAHKQIIDL